ncbi:MAG: DUF4212 domain-containing protein [Alphaproteobacteria bacterium]|nr:DUF4212 domain-containing protein [Alphaproteobacteria bacterium]MCY4230949.1 DUF4212 domain-containing protein [Alphaproteobacteria bacterium]MCY4320690.1 DUF4212 domain-containing protein [Alphaproteobacteria bacterium]
MAEVSAETRRSHWRKTSTLTYVVLAIWFLFGYVVPWFAKDLDAASFLGFPLGYYFIVQGSLIIFVLLIVVHNLLQDKIDEEHGVAEE